MIKIHLPLLIVLVLAGSLHAVDNVKTVTLPGSNAEADKVGTLAQAATHEAAGLVAMQEANTTPSRIIDAAMEFSGALKIYEAHQNFDKCQEMNADIFWCKKRMNLDDLYAYLARKKDDKDADAVANYEKIVAVAEKKVAPEEADAYLARAKKFAEENADKPFLITIRYFEVAQRFVGTPVSLEAQKLSLDAQEAQMRLIDTNEKKHRDTVFNHNPDKSTTAQVPVPSAADLKDAQPIAKKLFKDESSSTKKQKNALAWKYFDTAKVSKEEPKIRFALFNEAVGYAQQAGDIYAIVVFIDEIAKQFSGYDALVEKKAALTKIKSQEGATAALKLLDDPTDKDANTKVGKYICLIAQKWDIGLPLLAEGLDEKLAKVGEMELQKPSGAMQEMDVGDIWYDLGIKASSPYKEPMCERARHWYKIALPSLTAISKQKVEDRLEDLFIISPDPDADYNDLTDKQWDSLKAGQVLVNAGKPINDSGLTLKDGQQVRVVPNPSDVWKALDPQTRNVKEYNWKGAAVKTKNAQMFPQFMSLVCWVDNGSRQMPTLLTGPGHVYLGSNNFNRRTQAGVIRVKLMFVDD